MIWKVQRVQYELILRHSINLQSSAAKTACDVTSAMNILGAVRDATVLSMLMLRHLVCDGGQAADANVAVSPLSLQAATALLAEGARGATLDEISAFLGPAGRHAHATLASQVAQSILAGSTGDDGGPKVQFANGVWVDTAMRLKTDYARVVAQQYRAEVRPASFSDKPEEARSLINQWFSDSTAGRIKDLLPQGSVDGSTSAVLGNALYFKGAWQKKFEACLTQTDTFYLPNGSTVRTSFMSSTRRQYIACHPDYKVLRLPYAHGRDYRRRFSMYIYLPNERHGLQSLVHKLSSDPALLESSDSIGETRVGDFRIPKFTISYNINANALLRHLGLSLPFSPGAADFSGMLEPTSGPFFVSDVYHKCFVEVNEEGTEAAAASAMLKVGCALQKTPVKVVDFVADHPFMFLIKEDVSGVVIFVGQVIDPTR